MEKNIAEVMSPSQCIIILGECGVYSMTDYVNFNHLNKMVSARTLQYKLTSLTIYFITKYLGRNTF